MLFFSITCQHVNFFLNSFIYYSGMNITSGVDSSVAIMHQGQVMVYTAPELRSMRPLADTLEDPGSCSDALR